MRFLFPLDRVRLELDRTLRTRAFFARAIRGELSDLEYLDLIAQLGALVSVSGGERARPIVALARKDALAVARMQARGIRVPEVCAAIRFFGLALPSYAEALRADVCHDAGLAVVGTSWSREAATRMKARSRRPAALLAELAVRGPSSLARLEAARTNRCLAAQDIYAFAELTRGALLGVSTYLDSVWPAPVTMTSVSLEEWSA